MITLAFPKLEKALSKKTKNLPEDTPQKGVIIVQGHAIVFTDQFCLVCDLKDYFMIDCNISDPAELEVLDAILRYMNFKVFSKEFWQELTQGAGMTIDRGSLHISNLKWSKDLHHEELDANLYHPLFSLLKTAEATKAAVGSIALPYGVLQTIYSTLASEFKNDDLILEFSSQDLPVRFTFNNRKHFFGYIIPNYDATQAGFLYEALNYFTKDTEFVSLLEDEKKKMPPPPPSKNERVEEVHPNQTDAFGGNILQFDE